MTVNEKFKTVQCLEQSYDGKNLTVDESKVSIRQYHDAEVKRTVEKVKPADQNVRLNSIDIKSVKNCDIFKSFDK